MKRRTPQDRAASEREERLDQAIEQHSVDLFDQLVDAVEDSDEEVRSTAAYGLAEVHDPRAVPILIRLVDNDPDESVVDHALKSLESYRNDEILNCLLREATRARRSRPPRWHVANQLRFYNTEQSVRALMKLLHDEDAFVQQAAFDSLVELRPGQQRRWEQLLVDDQ